MNGLFSEGTRCLTNFWGWSTKMSSLWPSIWVIMLVDICKMGLHVQCADDDTSLMSLSQLRCLILLHCHSVVQLQRFTDLPKLLIHQLQSQ